MSTGPPRRVDGVELLGRADVAGYSQPVWLVCAGGERYLHATPRLYHVLLHADGARSWDEIARLVTADTGEETTSEQVATLVEHRLRPAGLVAVDGGATPQRPAAPPLLAIRHRLTLLPARLTAPAVEVLQHLYWPPVVVLTLAAAAAVNGWLLVAPDFRGVLQAVAAQPSWLLALLALQLPRAIFHELGHVSALRRAGVRHGAIGVALYVVFPVFFADVTHAHRLTRGQRVRVDLGGMYFDCVSTLALFAAFWATAQPVLLIGIVLTLLGMLAEFTPFLRFDGYYLLADLVGVPEPMSLFGPLLRDLWPRRRGAGRRLQLRRTARAVLLGYLGVVVLFLARPVLLLALAGDRVAGAFAAQGPRLGSDAIAAAQAQDWARAAVDAVGLASWSLVPIGLAVFSASLVRLAWRGGRTLLGRISR